MLPRVEVHVIDMRPRILHYRESDAPNTVGLEVSSKFPIQTLNAEDAGDAEGAGKTKAKSSQTMEARD